jgi:hypothetical protein
VREGGGAADAWRASLVVTLRRVLSIEALLPEQPEWDCGSVMPPCDLLKAQRQTHGLPFG